MRVCIHCKERLKTGEIGECFVCGDVLVKMDKLVDDVVKKLEEYEFESFDVGVRIQGSLKAMQSFLLEKMGIKDNLKEKIRGEFSKRFAEKTGKKREINGDVKIIINPEDLTFDFEIKPVYIYGRYKKRARDLSQTRWVCGHCDGAGCKLCNFSGKRYVSVEDLIVEPAVKMFEGQNAFLHGSGREDVDARMLGNGRPFILEILRPRKRWIHISELEKEINSRARGKVEVKLLFYAKARDVEKIKKARYNKTYRVLVRFNGEVDKEEIEKALKKLEESVIMQKTPSRVLHRRSDKVRRRRVIHTNLLLKKRDFAVVEIHAESGLYIKELVSGDNGRTKPSLAELLGVECFVERLDVVSVEGGLERQESAISDSQEEMKRLENSQKC